MKCCAVNLIGTLATGYILFFFSERLFWTVWWPGSSLPEMIVTWLAYSAVAYLFLAVVQYFRADNLWSFFLAGAIYGWLVEGGLADTLYGTQPSAPLPISVSITGLSWHALISVLIGWWAIGKSLVAERAQPVLWICIFVGVFWGVWAMFPRRETPPIITPVFEFLRYAALLTLGLIAAWWISWRAGVREFHGGPIGLVISALIVGTFYVSHFTALGLRPLLLPTLLIVALVPLSIHRRRGALAASKLFRAQPTLPRLLTLFVMPLVATLVYSVAAATGMDRLPWLAQAIYSATGLTGFVLLVLSISMIFWKAANRDSSKPTSS
jgi:hypothetical protein